LYDLYGSKILTHGSFLRADISDEFLGLVLDEFYRLVADGGGGGIESLQVEGSGVVLCRLNEITILVGICDSSIPSPSDMEDMRALANQVQDSIEKTSTRDAKDHFPTMFEERLKKQACLCFITEPQPSSDNKTGLALTTLKNRLEINDSEIYNAMLIGPYDAEVVVISPEQATDGVWLENEEKITAFAIVLAQGDSVKEKAMNVITHIRDHSTKPILVIPGSDAILEMARELEYELGLELCDSVSTEPSYLLLSTLATIGMIDMHPELARETWRIETSEKQVQTIDETAPVKDIGHQAFFVVDRTTGEAIFTYYYEAEERVFERAPNIVAAITQFKFQTTESSKTSVFQAGEFRYTIIEYENLIFTLITGEREDVEEIRARFSFLPDLWKDETPESLESSSDPYSSPPFTLKLLATLPPEQFPGRFAPYQVMEPEWGRFESLHVRDFLQAVWKSLDGTRTISQLVVGEGPQMTMGAIHFMNNLKALGFKIVIDNDDVPEIIGTPDDDIRTLYSHLDEIFNYIDGKRTIGEISRQLDIETSVLSTVIAELYKRKSVDILDKNSTAPKTS
jgi:hypothetical protein